MLASSDCGYSADLSGPVNARCLSRRQRLLPLNTCASATFCARRTRCRTPRSAASAGRGDVLIEQIMDEIAHVLGRDPLDAPANFYGLSERTRPTTGNRSRTTSCTRSCEPGAPQRLPCPSRSGRAQNASEPDHQARYCADAGEVRHLVQRDPSQSRPAHWSTSIPTARSSSTTAAPRWARACSPKGAAGGGAELGVATRRGCASRPPTPAKVPNTSATAASSGSDLNGMAAKDACRKLRTGSAEFVARRSGASHRHRAFCGGRRRGRYRRAAA